MYFCAALGTWQALETRLLSNEASPTALLAEVEEKGGGEVRGLAVRGRHQFGEAIANRCTLLGAPHHVRAQRGEDLQ